MSDPIKVSKKDVAAIVTATFPEYTGRKFKVNASGRVMLLDLNWSGGSRSQYRAATLDGKSLGGMDRWNHVWPGHNIAEGKTLDIPAGATVVRHSIFMGRDSGLTIFVNPNDMPRLLSNKKLDNDQ